MTIAAQTTLLVDAINEYAQANLDKKLDVQSGTAKGMKYTVVDMGNLAGPVAFDLASAQEFIGTLTADITVSFTTPPAATESQVVYLRLTNAGAFTITWPVGTIFAKGASPVWTAAGVDKIGVNYDSAAGAYIVLEILKDIK